jgi:DNA invertase Pin-like site-specific DNA recombinase
MAIYAYIRVSTDQQDHHSQIQKINKSYKIDKWYEDTGSGRFTQPKLMNLISSVQKGDTIVVYGFDRLGRNTAQVLYVAEQLRYKEVKLISIRENIDLCSPAGNFVFQMMCSVAEFELSLTRERVTAGIEAARKRGVKLGRPKNSENKKDYDKAIRMAKKLRKRGYSYRAIQTEVKSKINVKLSLGDLSIKIRKIKIDEIKNYLAVEKRIKATTR